MPFSQTRAAELRKYRKDRVEYLKANPYCAVMLTLGKNIPAVCIHHKRGRSGALLNDQRYWLPVSWEGHFMIHTSPEWARQKGFLCEKGKWGSSE